MAPGRGFVPCAAHRMASAIVADTGASPLDVLDDNAPSIGRRLNIAERTVQKHLSRTYGNLGVSEGWPLCSAPSASACCGHTGPRNAPGTAVSATRCSSVRTGH
ncbi:MAG TPA: hypothetical protein VGD71_33950 [Kribbella sp.]